MQAWVSNVSHYWTILRIVLTASLTFNVFSPKAALKLEYFYVEFQFQQIDIFQWSKILCWKILNHLLLQENIWDKILISRAITVQRGYTPNYTSVDALAHPCLELHLRTYFMFSICFKSQWREWDYPSALNQEVLKFIGPLALLHYTDHLKYENTLEELTGAAAAPISSLVNVNRIV